MRPKSILTYLGVLLLVITLSACGSDSSSSDQNSVPSDETGADDSVQSARYRITVTNITHSQPMSPLAVILHGDGHRAWELGLPASPGLEVLAEGGDPTDFIQMAADDPLVWLTASGADIIAPGGSQELDLNVTGPAEDLYLTAATMLVNSNDAYGGINAAPLSHLAVGQSAILTAKAYDAGTEQNSERPESIPGPAAGGEGYNGARDDLDMVRIHPGVISSDDGLAQSALTGAHRWDNPVFKLVVTREG